MDLLIRGGTVVTVGSRSQVDIGINNGQVVQLGERCLLRWKSMQLVISSRRAV